MISSVGSKNIDFDNKGLHKGVLQFGDRWNRTKIGSDSQERISEEKNPDLTRNVSIRFIRAEKFYQLLLETHYTSFSVSCRGLRGFPEGVSDK